MSVIFIINRVFYSSDDGHDCRTILGYVTEEEKAVKKVAELNRLHVEADFIKNKIDIHVNEVILPSLTPIYYEPIPQLLKWRPGISEKEITKEMREVREGIVALQLKAKQINREKSKLHTAKIESLKQAYIESLHVDPDVMKVMEEEGRYDSVNNYEYAKLEELI